MLVMAHSLTQSTTAALSFFIRLYDVSTLSVRQKIHLGYKFCLMQLNMRPPEDCNLILMASIDPEFCCNWANQGLSSTDRGMCWKLVLH